MQPGLSFNVQFKSAIYCPLYVVDNCSARLCQAMGKQCTGCSLSLKSKPCGGTTPDLSKVTCSSGVHLSRDFRDNFKLFFVVLQDCVLSIKSHLVYFSPSEVARVYCASHGYK